MKEFSSVLSSFLFPCIPVNHVNEVAPPTRLGTEEWVSPGRVVMGALDAVWHLGREGFRGEGGGERTGQDPTRLKRVSCARVERFLDLF